jgi:hypothetical protein
MMSNKLGDKKRPKKNCVFVSKRRVVCKGISGRDGSGVSADPRASEASVA